MSDFVTSSLIFENLLYKPRCLKLFSPVISQKVLGSKVICNWENEQDEEMPIGSHFHFAPAENSPGEKGEGKKLPEKI